MKTGCVHIYIYRERGASSASSSLLWKRMLKKIAQSQGLRIFTVTQDSHPSKAVTDRSFRAYILGFRQIIKMSAA